LQSAFRFNDAVIRNLVIKRDAALTEPTPLVKSKDEGEEEFKYARAAEEAARDEEAVPVNAIDDAASAAEPV